MVWLVLVQVYYPGDPSCGSECQLTYVFITIILQLLSVNNRPVKIIKKMSVGLHKNRKLNRLVFFHQSFSNYFRNHYGVNISVIWYSKKKETRNPACIRSLALNGCVQCSGHSVLFVTCVTDLSWPPGSWPTRSSLHRSGRPCRPCWWVQIWTRIC